MKKRIVCLLAAAIAALLLSACERAVEWVAGEIKDALVSADSPADYPPESSEPGTPLTLPPLTTTAPPVTTAPPTTTASQIPQSSSLLAEANVVTTPGAGFGAAGEGYIRISAFNSRENVLEAADRLKKIR